MFERRESRVLSHGGRARRKEVRRGRVRRLGAGVASVAVGSVLSATGPLPARAQEVTRIGIERGSVPPPLVLADVLRGREVDLGEYFGHRPVLLEFWATWCENCEALHPRMLAAHETFGDRMAFFAIAVAVGQSPRSVRRHLQREPVPWPTLWDADGQAVRAFEAPATSYVVILGSDGRVAYTGLGRDQDLGEAIGKVLAPESET